jgi:hypothetical protein
MTWDCPVIVIQTHVVLQDTLETHIQTSRINEGIFFIGSGNLMVKGIEILEILGYTVFPVKKDS